MAAYLIEKIPAAQCICRVANQGSRPIITSAQAALDLIGAARYECGDTRLVLQQQDISESFFDLKTGLAGEILQKFVNYGMRVAIVGDFSAYGSESLQAFIRESNRGKAICFAATEAEAVEKLLT